MAFDVGFDGTNGCGGQTTSDVGMMIRRGSRFRYRRVVRVLVATSEQELLQRIARAFDGADIEVIAMTDGRSAIAAIASGHASIDAVVIDPELADVAIDEVAAVVRAIDRDLAVLVWGDPESDVLEQVRDVLATDLIAPDHS